MKKKEFEALCEERKDDVFEYMTYQGKTCQILFMEDSAYILEDNSVKELKKCKREEKNGVLSINGGNIAGIPLRPENNVLIELVELYTGKGKANANAERTEAGQNLADIISHVASVRQQVEDERAREVAKFNSLADKIEAWGWTNGENGREFLKRAIEAGIKWDENSANTTEQNETIREINVLIRESVNKILEILDLRVQDSAYYYMKKNVVAKKDMPNVAGQIVKDVIEKYRKLTDKDIEAKLEAEDLEELKVSALLEMELYNSISHQGGTSRMVDRAIVEAMNKETKFNALADKIETWGWTNGENGRDFLKRAVESGDMWEENSVNTPEQNETIREINGLIEERKPEVQTPTQTQILAEEGQNQEGTAEQVAERPVEQTADAEVAQRVIAGQQTEEQSQAQTPETTETTEEQTQAQTTETPETTEEQTEQETERKPIIWKKILKVGGICFAAAVGVALVLWAGAGIKGCVDGKQPQEGQTYSDINSEEAKQAFVDGINDKLTNNDDNEDDAYIIPTKENGTIKNGTSIEVSVTLDKGYNVTATTVDSESVYDNKMIVEYTLSTNNTSPKSLEELKTIITKATLSFEVDNEPAKEPEATIYNDINSDEAKQTFVAEINTKLAKEDNKYLIPTNEDDTPNANIDVSMKPNEGYIVKSTTVVSESSSDNTMVVEYTLSTTNTSPKSLDELNTIINNATLSFVVIKEPAKEPETPVEPPMEEDVFTILNSATWLTAASNKVASMDANNFLNNHDVETVTLSEDGSKLYAQTSDTLYVIALNVNDDGGYRDEHGNNVQIAETTAAAILGTATMEKTYRSVEKVTSTISGARQLIQDAYSSYITENAVDEVQAYVKISTGKMIVGSKVVNVCNVTTIYIGTKNGEAFVDEGKTVKVANSDLNNDLREDYSTLVALTGTPRSGYSIVSNTTASAEAERTR